MECEPETREAVTGASYYYEQWRGTHIIYPLWDVLVYVYVYVYMYVYVYVYAYMYVYAYVYVYMYMCMYIHICICMCKDSHFVAVLA